MNELKKCPFCGGDAKHVYIDFTYMDFTPAIKCGCGACIIGKRDGAHEEADLEKAWNARKPMEKIEEEFLNTVPQLVGEVKCSDGVKRNRPLIDIAVAIEIVEKGGAE